MKKKLILVLAVVFTVFGGSIAYAKSYTSKPLKVVKTFYNELDKRFYAMTETEGNCRFLLETNKKDYKKLRNKRVIVKYAEYKNFKGEYYIVDWHTIK